MAKDAKRCKFEALQDAYFACTEQKMALSEAARVFGVPKTTLHDRLSGRYALAMTSRGPPPIMSENEERNLAEHLIAMARDGFGLSSREVVQLASEYVVHLGKRDEGHHLSRKWYEGFVRRHPDYRGVTSRVEARRHTWRDGHTATEADEHTTTQTDEKYTIQTDEQTTQSNEQYGTQTHTDEQSATLMDEQSIIQTDDSSEDDDDVFICGRCKSQFNDIVIFQDHKKTKCQRPNKDTVKKERLFSAYWERVLQFKQSKRDKLNNMSAMGGKDGKSTLVGGKEGKSALARGKGGKSVLVGAKEGKSAVVGGKEGKIAIVGGKEKTSPVVPGIKTSSRRGAKALTQLFNQSDECCVCLRKAPPMRFKGKVDWIQCSACLHWVHAGFCVTPLEESRAEFCCPCCL